MKTSHLALLAMAATVLVACGCSKLTYQHWKTINVGTSTPQAVEATLGDPWKKVDSTWIYNEPDRGVTAMVKFSSDRVVGKTWADADRGLETIGEQPDEPGETEEIHVQQVK